jgi:hypothetical protein
MSQEIICSRVASGEMLNIVVDILRAEGIPDLAISHGHFSADVLFRGRRYELEREVTAPGDVILRSANGDVDAGLARDMRNALRARAGSGALGGELVIPD